MSAPRLLSLLSVLKLWRSGALREPEIEAMAQRVIAVVEAAMRAVMFLSAGSVLQIVEDLGRALEDPPRLPPVGGWSTRYTIDVACGTARDHGSVIYRIAAAVRHGARAGHDDAPLPYQWSESSPPGVARSDRSEFIDAAHPRRACRRDVDAVLLACDALATAEEQEMDDYALERAEGAVEELEATIGPEAANWWRRRLRDLQREREEST